MYETQGWDSLYFNLKQTLLSEGSSYLPQAKTNFENLKSYVLNDTFCFSYANSNPL